MADKDSLSLGGGSEKENTSLLKNVRPTRKAIGLFGPLRWRRILETSRL